MCQNKFRFAGLLLVAALVSMPLGGAFAGAIGGGPIEEPMFCETPNDEAVIGSVSVDLGSEVLVPVYVNSDDCINNFRFVFTLHADLDFVAVVPGTWTNGFDPVSWNPTTRQLVVEHSTGGACMTPSIGDVFLSLRVTTHCKTVHNVMRTIPWGASDPENPSVFLGHDACNRDPISATNGSVMIRRIIITFDISEETGLIGDVLTVTVTCDNTYLFQHFKHFVQFDQAVLAAEAPIMDPAPRTAGFINGNYYGGDITVVQGDKASGFGTSLADGAEMYRLRFKIISPVDDVSGFVRFYTIPQVRALDCNQALHTLVPTAVLYSAGSVTVPPYRATLDLGEAVWNYNSLCEFKVPVLLQNNYPLSQFVLAVEYSGDANLPLEVAGVESADPLNWPLTGGQDHLCSPGKYTTVETFGPSTYPVSAVFDTIAWLKFRNDAPSTVPATYTLRLADYGCLVPVPRDQTWAETIDDARGSTVYFLPDPQLDGTEGTVTVGAPLAQAWVPGAAAQCHKPPIPPACDHFANTSLLVKANADLDQVQFNVTWDGTKGCVAFMNLLPNAQVVSQGTGTATIRVTSVAASANWRSFGTVRVTNGKHYDQTLIIGVPVATATEACTHTAITATGAGGSVFVYALGAQWQSCIPDVPDWKVAAVPERFELIQNHPNPFNASTLIEFNLPEAAHVRLEIFNIMGQRVETLMDDHTAEGRYSIRWDGRDSHGRAVASGVYLYRLQAGALTGTKKMVLLK